MDADIHLIGKTGRRAGVWGFCGGDGVGGWRGHINSKSIYGHVEFEQWSYQRVYSCLEQKLESIISRVSSNFRIL